MIQGRNFAFPVQVTIQKDFHLKLQQLFKIYGFEPPSKNILQTQWSYSNKGDVYYKDLKKFIEQFSSLFAKKYQNMIQIARNTLYQTGWIIKKSIGIEELISQYGQFMQFAKESCQSQQKLSQMRKLLKNIKESQKGKILVIDKQIQLSHLQAEDKLLLKDLLKNIARINQPQQLKDKDQSLWNKQIIQVLQSLKLNSPNTVSTYLVPKILKTQLMESMKKFLQYLEQNFIDYKRTDNNFARLIKAMSSASDTWMETKLFEALSKNQQTFIYPLFNSTRQLRQKIATLQKQIKQVPPKSTEIKNNIEANHRQQLEKRQRQLNKALENNTRLAQEINKHYRQIQKLNKHIQKMKQKQQADKRQAQKNKQITRINTAVIRQPRRDEQLKKNEQYRKLAEQVEQMRNNMDKTQKQLQQSRQYVKLLQKQKANVQISSGRQSLNAKYIKIQPKTTDSAGKRLQCIIDMLNQILVLKNGNGDLFVNKLYNQKNMSQNDRTLLFNIFSLKTSFEQLCQKHEEQSKKQQALPQKKMRNQELQQAQQLIKKLRSENNQLKTQHKRIEEYESQLSNQKIDKQKMNQQLRKLKEQSEKRKNQAIIQPNTVQPLKQDKNQQKIDILRINQRKLQKNYSQLYKLYNSEKRQNQRLLKECGNAQKIVSQLSKVKYDYESLEGKYEMLSKAKGIDSTMIEKTSSQIQKSIDFVSSFDNNYQLSRLREEIKMKQTTIKAISTKFQQLIEKKQQKISSLQLSLWELQSRLQKDQTINRI